MIATPVTPDNLNDLMEFDHTIIVHEDGSVTSADQGVRSNWAPDLRNGELDPYSAERHGWTLMGGYTGQYGGGDTMHNSEFIGGRMAEDILSTPGVYVALVCYWDPEGPEDGDGEVEDYVEGWAVARRDLD